MEGHTISRQELEYRFQFHPADSDNKRAAHQGVRDACLEAADKCVELTGAPSPEQSLAVRKIEEGMMWFNAALARGDGPRA